jgi:hypothetical protein
MPFVDTSSLDVIERLPGWYGRYFHSPSMTFAHCDFVRGSSIHEHFHVSRTVESSSWTIRCGAILPGRSRCARRARWSQLPVLPAIVP